MLERLRNCYFFGTFNPIHMGHLAMAQAALGACPEITRVIFVPAGIPPHRPQKELLPAIDRYKLVELAIGDNPQFQVNPYETHKSKRSYTIETLLALEPGSFQDNGPRIPLLMGADTVATLPSWHQAEDLLAHTHILTVARPDSSVSFSPPSSEIVPMPPLAVSASWIRQQFLDNQPESCRYLLPKPVFAYLRANNALMHWQNGQT